MIYIKLYCDGCLWSLQDMQNFLRLPKIRWRSPFKICEEKSALGCFALLLRTAVCTGMHCPALSCTVRPVLRSWMVLHCPALSWMVLHCPALSFYVLHYPEQVFTVPLSWLALDCTVLTLSCAVLHWSALSCTVLHCYALSFAVLDCPALACIICSGLLWTALKCTFLHCPAWACTCRTVQAGNRMRRQQR